MRDAATKRLLGLSVLAGVFVLWGCEPSTSGTCAATPEEVWIVQSLFFGRIDGATSPGFNLDAIQGMQCGARDYVSPEGERGIDNQFGGLLPIVEAQAVGGMPLDYLVQDSIASGQILLAFELGGVDAWTDDGCVSTRLRRLSGTPLLGTDNLLLSGQTLYPEPTAVINDLGEAAIREGSLEPAPADIVLPISILDARFILNVRDAHIRLTSVDEDHVEGVISGGIDVEEILAVVATLNIPSDLMATAEALVRGNADLVPMGRDCAQLSAVLEFRAVRGFIGE